MRILVTGAHGMLARTLVRELEHRGHEVVGMGRDTLDVTDATAVERVVREWVPEAVIQCAVLVKAQEFA